MKKRILQKGLLILMALTAVALKMYAKKSYDVAAYVYPAYAADDPRLRPFWPMGIGEWETVMTMQQRNPGHYWKRYPLGGYLNEADPAVMEMEINQAADHGVNVFIFDWYWYDGRPFMETTLTNGFLKARNNNRMQFYPAWAGTTVHALARVPSYKTIRPKTWNRPCAKQRLTSTNARTCIRSSPSIPGTNGRKQVICNQTMSMATATSRR